MKFAKEQSGEKLTKASLSNLHLELANTYFFPGGVCLLVFLPRVGAQRVSLSSSSCEAAADDVPFGHPSAQAAPLVKLVLERRGK